jgi:tetratricopeptide (TPR) repeat protein
LPRSTTGTVGPDPPPEQPDTALQTDGVAATPATGAAADPAHAPAKWQPVRRQGPPTREPVRDPPAHDGRSQARPPLARRLERAAIRYWAKVTGRAPAGTVASILQAARRLSSSGDLNGALAVCRNAPVEHQNDPRLEAQRRKLEAKGRKLETRRSKVAARVRRAARKRINSLARELRRLESAGDGAAALAMCEAAPRKDRADPRIGYRYGRLLQQAGRFGEAYDAFRAFAASHPSHRDAWLAASSLLVQLGRRAELSALLDDMLDALPATADTLIEAAVGASNGGLHERALKLCNDALSAGPCPDPNVVFEVARILLQGGRQSRAIELLDNADFRSDARLARRASDLRGLALAQLRFAGRACGQRKPRGEGPDDGVVIAATAWPEDVHRRAERHLRSRPERWWRLGFEVASDARSLAAGRRTNGKQWPRVSIVLATHRAEMIDNVSRNVVSQDYPDLEVIVVLNKDDYDEGRLRERLAAVRRRLILRQPQHRNLGSCINLGAAHASGAYVTKMDDDDFYGPSYISDLLLSALESDADITGKRAAFYHFEDGGEYCLKYPRLSNRWLWPGTGDDGSWVVPRLFWRGRTVAGATLFFKRDVLLRCPFDEIAPYGEDTLFQLACRRAGMTIYASDEFNFLYKRRAGNAGHLWKIRKDDFMQDACVFAQFDSRTLCV